MHPHLTFTVTPNLPVPLEPLREIVYNLWWTWEPSARQLFRTIDTSLWQRTNHSPLRILQLSSQARLEELAQDEDFLHRLQVVYNKFKSYITRADTYWARSPHSASFDGPIAYFSAEFGFHESIPIYSGGLGILSGDHCKAASDLGLDFVAVTLLYRHGYFKQLINSEGWQEAVELDQNFHHLPVTEVLQNGKPVIIEVELLDRSVFIKIWKMAVGRITLYALDTDLPENSEHDRLITAQLYGGDKEMRIQQEIVLGIGGIRALEAMDIKPSVYHMNEGHSAFLSLERIRRKLRDNRLTFRAALQIVASSNVFTTHTPVPAGNDAFSPNLMRRYFNSFCEEVDIDFEEFFHFGQASENPEPDFSMTILALRTSRHANGVSKLHGSVSRKMWKTVWSGVPVDEVPIASVTNGVHTKTWLADEIAGLYDKYLGPDWEDHLTDQEFWRRVHDIPSHDLWTVHQELKSRLIEFTRERVRLQRKRNGESPEELRKAGQILERDILTIGFARRFATYKRATLLFSDEKRLHRLLNHPERPVQFIFAGKAHPADEGGKAFIQKVIEFTRKEGFENRITFIEDYDAHIGRRLYQGCDLWLNNPLRPLEASGTSGMKLPPNGGINLSILDGWWCEAYNANNGWAIGEEIEDGEPEFQTKVDAASLYQLLENQIVPLYYTNPDGVLPLAWIQIMKESMRTITPVYNTERMVAEYFESFYMPAMKDHDKFTGANSKNADKLATWKENMRRDWDQISIIDCSIDANNPFNIPFGRDIKISARVQIGPISPDDIIVQAYYGETDDRDIFNPKITNLTRIENAQSDGICLYSGSVTPADAGSFGLSIRVIPTSDLLCQPHELRLITWSKV